MPKITTKMLRHATTERGWKRSKHKERLWVWRWNYSSYFEDSELWIQKPKRKSEPRFAVGYEFQWQKYNWNLERGGYYVNDWPVWKVTKVLKNKTKWRKYVCVCNEWCCTVTYSESRIRYKLMRALWWDTVKRHMKQREEQVAVTAS